MFLMDYSLHAFGVLKQGMVTGTFTTDAWSAIVSCEVVSMADFCGLPHLAEVYETALRKFVADDTVGTILIASDALNLEVVKKQCLDYIADR